MRNPRRGISYGYPGAPFSKEMLVSNFATHVYLTRIFYDQSSSFAEHRRRKGQSATFTLIVMERPLEVHLVDGTYELFRHYYALPSARDSDGREVAAVRGVVASILSLVREGATHIGVATDHVIESFRNQLWPGYKTSAGVEPDLLSQFPLLEQALVALGVVVWPMVEFEADDALAAAALAAAQDERVERVVICTPDKDLAQCVRGNRIVQLNRRTASVMDQQGVIAKFGVAPESIPDYLALVGDAADGYPGLTGWGAKSAAAVLSRYAHIEHIPEDCRQWPAQVSRGSTLSSTLCRDRELAILFRRLATLRTDVPVFQSFDELQWQGPTQQFASVAAQLDGAVVSPRLRPRS